MVEMVSNYRRDILNSRDHRLRLRSLSDHLLSALLLNQINLVELSLLGTNVASVSPELLASFVVGIPRVDMVPR